MFHELWPHKMKAKQLIKFQYLKKYKMNSSINMASFVKLCYDFICNNTNNRFQSVFCIWNYIDYVSLPFFWFLPDTCTPYQIIWDLLKIFFLTIAHCRVIAFKIAHKSLSNKRILCAHVRRLTSMLVVVVSCMESRQGTINES